MHFATDSYLCRTVKEYWFLHYVWKQKRFSGTSFRWWSLFSFSQFSCEKLKRVAPSEAVPGFSNGMTISYYNFQISVIFPKYLLLLIHSTCKNNAQLTSIVSYDTMAAMAQRPPSPRPCWITTRTRGSRQKGYQRVAGVSTRRFDKAAMKKARAITSKTHLLSKGTLSRCT